MLFELIRRDEKGIDVHIRRRVFDEPLNPFDHGRIAECIPIERVEKENAPSF